MGNVFRSVLAAARAILQSKTVAAGTSDITVSPDSGYDGLSSVTVQPTPSQTKSVNPTRAAQTVSPDSGKLLSSVSVGGIPSEYIIPSGAKSITANGTDIDVSSYATANVNVSGTSITPSNTIPASMSGGTLYTPSASGYAISSYDNVAPSGTPLRYYANEMVRFENAGYIIDNYQIVSPSDLSPTSLTSGNIYKPDAAGYFIGSYSSVSPSSSGTYFSGGMKRMVSNGYAYSSKPQMTETTLWTNSSPTTSFSAQAVTLSQSMANFDYIKIQYAKTKDKTGEFQPSIIVSYADFLHTKSSEDSGRIKAVLYYYDTYRRFYYVSDTSIQFNQATSGSTSYPSYNVPIKISGLKY